MAVNTMTFNQLATVLASITSQATGKTALTATDDSSFVSVAKTALESGYDPLSTAISQVLSKTIFSVRPYTRKFKGLEYDKIQFGNHVRKINYIDKPFEEDDRVKLADGYAIDQQVVNKPSVIQTNWYGENVVQKTVTTYKDQLDCAFSSADEFQQFIAGVLQNTQDMIEQARENTARATLANLIGGHIALDAASATDGCVVHLLTEYNAHTGDNIDASTVYNPSVFPDFAKWLYGRIKTLSKMLQERSVKHHLNFTAGDILRHTPVSDQRLYMLGGAIDQIGTNVLSDVFNEEYMRILPFEEVMFWQSINSPDAIKITAGYTNASGAAASASVDKTGVFGVLLDREAAGVTIANEWSMPSPFNARGGYVNTHYHFTCRYFNDHSENCVVLMLD